MTKGRLFPVVVGLALTVVVLWLQLTSEPLVRQLVQRLDYLAYDLRLKAALGPPQVDPRVVIVDIDEKSLRREGHWPWPRDHVARLVQKLFAAGAKVVAFDVVFAEPERNSAQMVLDRMRERGIGQEAVGRLLGEHLSEFDNNAVFARQIANRKVVLGFILYPREEGSSGKLPPPLAFVDPSVIANTTIPEAASYTANVAILHAPGTYGGFFNIKPDVDGVSRKAPMIQRVGDQVFPSLALEAARLYLDVNKINLRTSSGVIDGIDVGDRVIPTDYLARTLIPFRGPQGSFPYVPATDVLHDQVDKKLLDGKIVLVGTSASGLFDLRATPIEAVYPGVEVHANLIAGILDNNLPKEPSWADAANFAMTLMVGVMLAFLLPRLSSSAMVVATVTIGMVAFGVIFASWSDFKLNLSTSPAIFLIGSIGPFNIAYGFWRESRDRRRLKEMFGQYVPPQLVEEMNRNPEEAYGFQGESREMSVLFCDIRGFTAISEKLTAGQLKEMLNQFFTPMTRVIFDHRGTIDKYVGDMIMAFWGAPVDDPNHATHAVTASLAMQKEALRLSTEFKARGLPPVAVGIGVNSGVMNVGDMGSEYRRAYTVIGDAVNLASRLEATTRYYGVGLVIGEETYRRIADTYICRELDRVRVKGKTAAITVYEPLYHRNELTPELEEELNQHTTALAHFRAREWDAADAAFATLQEAHPYTRLYALYRERIVGLRTDDPGEGWDGVYERTSK